MNYSINVNTDSSVILSNQLERISRSAFPVAVRSVLNKAAFDVKQNTMLKSSALKFENRQKNFFKANSRVEMAKGFDVKSMKSEVGFISNRLKGSQNYAVKDLEAQESGGSIKRKSFIPMNTARGGKNKLVRPINRLQNINNIVKTSDTAGKTEKEKFVKSVLHAGPNGFVLSNFKGKKILWRINSLNKETNQFKAVPIYSFRKGRSVHVNQTSFMKSASLVSANKMQKWYKDEAEKQFFKNSKYIFK